MKKNLLIVSLLFAVFLGFFIFYTNKNVNILNSKTIDRGEGWKNNESSYSGSELNFSFRGSDKIGFTFNSNSKSDQGVEILVDGNSYLLSSPNLNNQNLSIITDKSKPHTVTIRHFCTHLYDPCQISISGIYVNKGTKIYSYKLHDKVLSVLGDSISTIYGKNNFTQILANNLGYELHDASVMGSTLSIVPNTDSALKRYQKDLLTFKPNAILIFIGTNDVNANVSTDIFEKNYSEIVNNLKRNNPKGKIFIAQLLYRKDIDRNKIDLYNQIIKNIAEKNDVYLVNTNNWIGENDLSDDVHPSVESQSKLANNFQKALLPYLK